MKHRNKRPKERNSKAQQKNFLHSQAKALEKELVKGKAERKARA